MFVFDSLVFFFKQTTAYEMRISDWSSDVCSSDLRSWLSRSGCRRLAACDRYQYHRHAAAASARLEANGRARAGQGADHRLDRGSFGGIFPGGLKWKQGLHRKLRGGAWQSTQGQRGQSTEEHTSELQTIMRISSAVICFKTKTQHHHIKL